MFTVSRKAAFSLAADYRLSKVFFHDTVKLLIQCWECGGRPDEDTEGVDIFRDRQFLSFSRLLKVWRVLFAQLYHVLQSA